MATIGRLKDTYLGMLMVFQVNGRVYVGTYAGEEEGFLRVEGMYEMVLDPQNKRTVLIPAAFGAVESNNAVYVPLDAIEFFGRANLNLVKAHAQVQGKGPADA